MLVREDLNVPLSDGRIADVTRIDAALPTLNYLHRRGARTIIMSHLGRPDGSRVESLSLRALVPALMARLNLNVQFAPDCIGAQTIEMAKNLKNGEVLLLENVRFHPEEEANEAAFAHQLAQLGELYVNDAFGTAHRAHASTEGVAHLLPSAAGLLMEAELAALSPLISGAVKPFVCVIGGAKIKDKVGVFKNLMERVTAFCVGGGMANTFLAAQGRNVGKSLRDRDDSIARMMLEAAKAQGVEVHLPVDAVVAPDFDADSKARSVLLDDVHDEMILDIGPKTAQNYARVIEAAKTIVFNGPMGVYEKKFYQNGTLAIGKAIARATERGAKSVVGGGDAAAAAHELGFADAMTHVSTGGGATLEFLEGKTLPGVAALMAKVPS
ncbi:MAG: phosphoglycerate kinase [Candidatus Eremiobacteraeota bacterium]|nr:phosphoglycerate kinase [Candidatus Eremiobacteraeota bacterium]